MNNKGFNIIELIVVISVMGLLAGTAVFAYRSLFKRSQLEKTMNQVRGFYEGVNRGAVTEGYGYTFQLDRVNESLKYISSNTSKMNSLVLCEGLDLNFLGDENIIRLYVHVDGFVRDLDGIRDFSVIDSSAGKSIYFYVSPLGVMEARLQ